jgi:hypothetical protein
LKYSDRADSVLLFVPDKVERSEFEGWWVWAWAGYYILIDAGKR